jgi:D-alanyl-D-alanine carboxypeptidase
MLPSGNDAAVTLAEGFTELLIKARARPGIAASKPNSKNKEMGIFIKEMNIMAKKLHMKQTNYTNPHGLSEKSNHSTAYELAYLSSHAMKN